VPDPVVAVAGGSIFGGLISGRMQSRAQDKAAKSYGKSANAQTQAIMEMYYQTREDLEPYMKMGGKGLQDYYNLLTKGPGEFKFEETPGYQFRLEEGEKAIDRSATARGQFFSGKRGKALTEYAQDYATNAYNSEYDKFMNRYYKKLDAYGNLMNVGEAAAARVGAAGQTAVGQSANVQMGAAGGRASSYLNKGDIWGNFATNTAGTLGDYAQRYGAGYGREASHTQTLGS